MEEIEEQEAFMQDFSSIKVYKQDTFESPTDFRKTNLWQLTKKTKYIGDYTLTVTDADF